ncbi:DEAD-box ATP-dependent RNA helicase 39 [Linum grandiflorum]
MRRASVTFFRKLAAGAAESKPRTEQLTRLRPFSSSYEKPRESTEKKLKKESSVLEKFRQRKLQGSQLKNSLQKSSSGDLGIENRGHGAAEVVTSGFAELGLKNEIISAAEEMGVRVPDEIQCVGIPAILEGKSVVLSCEDGDGGGRTLAYLLPLIQLLRQNETVRPNSKKHPKAVVLCPTEDVADELKR